MVNSANNTTETLTRDTALGFDFGAVTYYDGQGFMVRKKLNISSALELSGASVCTQQGTTTELNLADFFRANKLKYEPVIFATSDETIKAYDAGRCDVFTTDASGAVRRSAATDDVGCVPAPGTPCDFSVALSSRVLGGVVYSGNEMLRPGVIRHRGSNSR